MIFGPNFIKKAFKLEFEHTKIIAAIAYVIISYLIFYEGQYYIIEETGPYGVGKRTKIIKKEGYSLTLSIFYPIDKSTHIQGMKDKTKTDAWYTSGYFGIDSVAKVTRSLSWLQYQNCVFRVRAVNNVELHKDFANNHKKLTPIICSHGLTRNRHSLSFHINEMVSYGCIVYSCDHTDLSCAAYTDHNTSEKIGYQEYDFSPDNKETQEEYRYKQLDIRVNKDFASIVELIKEEAQPNKLPCIDLEKLTAFGHSLGAMTAVHAAYTFPKDFKLCLAMDIYFKPMYQEIEGNDDYALAQPICIITSENFHEISSDKYKDGYNCDRTRNQFYDN